MTGFFFRPLPWLSLFFLPMFAVLVALGFWQLERLQWKLALISEMSTHLHAPPLSLDQILKVPPNRAQYRRVVLEGRFENGDEAYVYSTDEKGIPVYHLVVPFKLIDGRTLFFDRGIIPLSLRNPATRRRGILEGVQRVVGIWRTPDAPGFFTPKPDLAHRVWYSRDISGMARTFKIVPAAPVIVEADATPVPGGWPKGGQTVVTLRNDHLEYALTWFLLAAGLVVVYFAYHRSRDRLGFRR